MKESLILHFPGLGDDPTMFLADGVTPTGNTFCGARAHLESLQRILNADLWVVAWDAPNIADVISRAMKYPFKAWGGHSHGSETARKAAELQAPNSINAGYQLDDCPPGNPFAPLQPIMPPAAYSRGYGCWQHNCPLLPHGQPFLPTLRFIAQDVSGEEWRENGKLISHIDAFGCASIAGSDKVWNWIRTAVIGAYNTWKLAP